MLFVHPSVYLSICPSLVRSCPSIFSELSERFSLNFGQLFIPVRLYAELMTEVFRLKVKVTVEDYGI